MAQAAYSHVALDYGDMTKSEEEEEKKLQEAEKRKKELEAAEAKRKEEEEEATRREEEAKYEPPYPIPEGLIVVLLQILITVFEHLLTALSCRCFSLCQRR